MDEKKGIKDPIKRQYSPRNEERKNKASGNIEIAFDILSLRTEDNLLICPSKECHTSNPKKIQIRKAAESSKKYWKCHKCGAAGDAIELLIKYGGYSFADAIKTLLGEGEIKILPRPETDLEVAPTFIARVDVELYNEIVALGSFEESAKYYAQWHIDPQAVSEAGSTTIVDTKLSLIHI